MKLGDRLITLVVSLLILAGLLFALKACDSDNTPPAPRATPTVAPIPSTSTDYIVDKIKARLTQTTGRAVALGCPERINLVKGTTMKCPVHYADDPTADPIAEAVVTMKDKTGVFTWVSNPT